MVQTPRGPVRVKTGVQVPRVSERPQASSDLAERLESFRDRSVDVGMVAPVRLLGRRLCVGPGQL